MAVLSSLLPWFLRCHWLCGSRERDFPLSLIFLICKKWASQPKGYGRENFSKYLV